MSEGTLFTKIIRGDIPSDKVYEDEEFCAFRDIHPGAPLHVLVVPRKEIPTIMDAVAEDAPLLGRLLLAANKVARLLGLDAGGCRYVINYGKDGGLEVMHLHLHILGGRRLHWPPG